MAAVTLVALAGLTVAAGFAGAAGVLGGGSPAGPPVRTSASALTGVRSRIESRATSTLPPATSITPPGTGDLADASLLAVSWLSAQDGWALAGEPCAEGSCAVVARTTDGGASWQPLPGSPALVNLPGTNCVADKTLTAGFLVHRCVTGIAFATPTIGYLYGTKLLMTTDGGTTWQTVPGTPDVTLAIGDGEAFRIVSPHSGCPAACTPSVQVAPIGSTTWHTVLGPIANVGNASPTQLLIAGSDLYAVGYGNVAGGAQVPAAKIYRSLDGGATFELVGDPCIGEFSSLHVLTTLSAAPDGFLAGVCTTRNETSVQSLITSSDAGGSWQVGGRLPTGSIGVIAGASSSTIAVATRVSSTPGVHTATLRVTTDGGAAWTTAATDTSVLVSNGVVTLVFSDAQSGSWLPDPHQLWTSDDGGASWTEKPFG